MDFPTYAATMVNESRTSLLAMGNPEDFLYIQKSVAIKLIDIVNWVYWQNKINLFNATWKSTYESKVLNKKRP